MKKQKLSGLLALVMTASILTGCGQADIGKEAIDDTTSGTTSETETTVEAESGIYGAGAKPIGVSEYTGLDVYQLNDGKDFEIRITIPGGSSSAYWWLVEEANEAFKADYPNVSVILDGSGDTAIWRQNAAVEFAGSEPPSISWCVPSYANSFIQDGLIIDWADVYKIDRYSYFTDFLTEAQRTAVADQEGHLPFLPHEGTIGAVYYNKTMFSEHGWEIPKTFDDLLALSDKINASGIAPFAVGGADFRYTWLTTQMMVSTAGVDKTRALATKDFDQWGNEEYGFPQTLEALQQLIDHKFFHNGINGISMSIDEPAMMIGGEIAMSYEGIWRIAQYINAGGTDWVNANLDVFSFPNITENGDGDAIVGGTPAGYVISTKQEEYQIEASLEYCKYLTSQKYMSQLIENGYSFPAGKVDYDQSKVPTVTNKLYQMYLAAAVSIGPMDGLTSKPEIDMTLKKEVVPMMIAGEMTAEQGIKRMQEVATSD